MSSILEQVDQKLSQIRIELYKAFEYEDVDDVMNAIDTAIDEVGGVQDLLLEVQE